MKRLTVILMRLIYGGYVLHKFEQMADKAAGPLPQENVTHYV